MRLKEKCHLMMNVSEKNIADGFVRVFQNAKYKDKTSYIAAQVILHELGHALMHNSQHKTYASLFEYWVEEALANKIALNYLYLASIRLGMNKLF